MRYAVAALALAVACGGGGGEKPAAAPSSTPAPTQSTTVVTPEAKAVRDAAAKTLAACPCDVEVWVGAHDTGHRVTLTGVYDAKTQTTELREIENGKPSGVVFRIVEGRTFADPGTGQWIELDFSGLPKKAATAFVPMALADPRITFAAVSNVTVASALNDSDLGTLNDVEYDMATAAAATGPWAELVKRLVPEASVYDKLWIENGMLHRASLSASGSPAADDDGLNVTLTVTKTGVAAPNVTIPDVVRKVDVATFTG